MGGLIIAPRGKLREAVDHCSMLIDSSAVFKIAYLRA